MSCINTLNDHPGFCAASPPMSPRISFSNDFAVEAQPPPPPPDPAAADPSFEFAVGIRPMIAADELFFKGRMLPLSDPNPQPTTARSTTLRDELRLYECSDDGNLWARQQKGYMRWKDLLGLGRAYSRHSARKNDKVDGCSDAAGAATELPEINAGKLTQKSKRQVYEGEDAV